MKKKYLVIGAGEVGPAICHRLLMHQDTGKVSLWDKDLSRAEDAVQHFKPFVCRQSRTDLFNCFVPGVLDIATVSPTQLMALFGGFDCVISAIPAKHSPQLARIAVGAGVHFCELGGVTDVTRDFRDFKQLASNALENGVSIIHDCGFAPGLSGQMAQVLVRRADIVPRSVIVYVGGLPQHPAKEYFSWQRTFSGIGIAELLTSPHILRGGRFETEPSCGIRENKLTLSALAEFDTSFGTTVKSRMTAGAGAMPEIMHSLGVQDCWEETLRWDWDAFLAFIRDIPDAERAAAIEHALPHTDTNHPDIAIMRVVAQSERTRSYYELCTLYDAHLGMSAMAKVTGYTAADTARLAALGRTPAGVMAPEELNWQTNAELIEGLSAELGITLRG
jgi:saccharopine dehydrogenase-like NADP-dependent oxidoreductase